MSRHLLVTNDFPPKIGGIQTYLHELWRRLPPDSFSVYTTPYDNAAVFDAHQDFLVRRSPEPVIGPYPWLVPRLNRIAEAENASLIVIDPAVPLGAIGPYLNRSYAVVLHGAEVTVPGRLPVARTILSRTLSGASLVISAGEYALAEAERCAGRSLPSVVVPPGVDINDYQPFSDADSAAARHSFGIANEEFLVATVNRLVPRKGMDVLISAAKLLADRGVPIRVLIGGRGRSSGSLAAQITDSGAPVELLGRISEADKLRLYGAADVMAMLCHDRWFGLEQEGFGIVFLEAAAAGLPQVAGRSGGAHEAVEHGSTGLVVDDGRDIRAVADALEYLWNHPEERRKMGLAARKRAVAGFDYDLLAAKLGAAIEKTSQNPYNR